MDRRFNAVALILVAAAWCSCASQAQQGLPSDATLRSVAEANGVRGGDLAEALGLPRSADKDKPLADMGIMAEDVEQALGKLGASPSPAAGRTDRPQVDTSMTVREIATALDMNGRELAKDLLLSIDVDKDVSIQELGVSEELLGKAVAHNLAEHHERLLPGDLKYPIYLLIVLFAMGYLVRWGIPRNADPRKRRTYYPQWVFIVALAVSVAVLGFALGKSPNPMEGAVKVFKATVGLYEAVGPKLAALVFFLALAAVANKAVCGWACPFGALEELIYMLPLFKRAKRWQLPFWIGNTIRVGLFVAFLLIMYGLVGDKKGFVVYHYLNPFNLFNLDFSIGTLLYLIPAYLAISFIFYRPFCRLICPFGLLSWFLEWASLTKVRIDRERCTDCKACAKACPLTAAGDRLAGKPMPSDCFSCMRCLRVCPADAIHYRPAWGPPSPPASSSEAEAAA